MPGMPVFVDRHGSQDSRRRKLLALQRLRRSMECVPFAGGWTWRRPMAMKRSRLVRELLELVAALDRRMPQAQRAGEVSIARDAAALKARAMKRIEEIEHGTDPAGPLP